MSEGRIAKIYIVTQESLSEKTIEIFQVGSISYNAEAFSGHTEVIELLEFFSEFLENRRKETC